MPGVPTLDGHAPLPATLDAVVDRLDAEVEAAASAGSRLGYFPALYRRVTDGLRTAVHDGAFADNGRMARLGVVFANRYLDASARHRRGEPTTLSWQVAFDAAARGDLSVLQHLLLGMNAHINLDLGIACAEVAPGRALASLEADFGRINNLLFGLRPIVESQLTEISVRFGLAVDIARTLNNFDQRVGDFSLREARRSAWRFARVLSALRTRAAREVAVRARDAETVVLGVTIQKPGALSELLGGSDTTAVSETIGILARRDNSTAFV
jgi:hypothetical protein